MSQFIRLPHFQQSADGQCLPACARMVLARIDLNLSEQEIGRIIGAREIGTPSFAVRKLAALNVQVTYQEWTTAALLATLSNQEPVIIFVRTGFMDYYQEDFAHAVVVVGAVENQQFWIYDPAQSTGPRTISWDGLLAAWAEFGYRGATITKA